MTRVRDYSTIFSGDPELYFIVFFFQAEDGIRCLIVTGVQTCALPILLASGETTGEQRQLLNQLLDYADTLLA